MKSDSGVSHRDACRGKHNKSNDPCKRARSQHSTHLEHVVDDVSGGAAGLDVQAAALLPVREIHYRKNLQVSGKNIAVKL